VSKNASFMSYILVPDTAECVSELIWIYKQLFKVTELRLWKKHALPQHWLPGVFKDARGLLDVVTCSLDVKQEVASVSTVVL
jgi:hypothetical protein